MARKTTIAQFIARSNYELCRIAIEQPTSLRGLKSDPRTRKVMAYLSISYALKCHKMCFTLPSKAK